MASAGREADDAAEENQDERGPGRESGEGSKESRPRPLPERGGLCRSEEVAGHHWRWPGGWIREPGDDSAAGRRGRHRGCRSAPFWPPEPQPSPARELPLGPSSSKTNKRGPQGSGLVAHGGAAGTEQRHDWPPLAPLASRRRRVRGVPEQGPIAARLQPASRGSNLRGRGPPRAQRGERFFGSVIRKDRQLSQWYPASLRPSILLLPFPLTTSRPAVAKRSVRLQQEKESASFCIPAWHHCHSLLLDASSQAGGKGGQNKRRGKHNVPLTPRVIVAAASVLRWLRLTVTTWSSFPSCFS